jgi:hypothetical protein
MYQLISIYAISSIVASVKWKSQRPWSLCASANWLSQAGFKYLFLNVMRYFQFNWPNVVKLSGFYNYIQDFVSFSGSD